MNMWVAVVSILAAATAGFLCCALLISRKITDVRSLATVSDPSFVIEDEDGSVIMETTVLEWVGRAFVTHSLPPNTLDKVRVYLDGIEVIGGKDGL